MFLYNIVKMLLVIAVVAADASICVWTMFHFGIVVGLSLVMVINFGLAGLFGFFVLRYSKRERGMMHMEYGQHMFKGVTDVLDKNNLTGLGEQLATLTGTLNVAEQGGVAPSRAMPSRGDRSVGEDDYDSANGRGGSGRYAERCDAVARRRGKADPTARDGVEPARVASRPGSARYSRRRMIAFLNFILTTSSIGSLCVSYITRRDSDTARLVRRARLVPPVRPDGISVPGR